MHCKCYKVYVGYIEFNSIQRKNRRKTKPSFPKESLENTDFYKGAYIKYAGGEGVVEDFTNFSKNIS